MNVQKFKSRKNVVSFIRHVLPIISLILFSLPLFAQDGSAGITEATSKVKGYFTLGAQLVYAICAIIGLVGAIKIFKKWNDGDHDTGKVATSWFGSCIFAVLVTTILKSFFGL